MRCRILVFIFFWFQVLMLNAQIVHVSPQNNSVLNLPKSRIIIRLMHPLDKDFLHDFKCKILDQNNHSYDYTLNVCADEKTLNIKSCSPYPEGSTIYVSIQDITDAEGGHYSVNLEFSVGKNNKQVIEKARIPYMQKSHLQSLDNPPDFPQVTVDIIDSTKIADGYIFFHNFHGIPEESDYIAIIDNYGEAVYSRRVETITGMSFKLQKNGMLTFWDYNLSAFVMMDSSYTDIDTLRCVDGYITNFHDCRVTPENHVWLFAYDEQYVDLSDSIFLGNHNALVEGVVIQELDEDRNLVFQWRSWDHFSVFDAVHITDYTADEIRFIHCNSLDLDSDTSFIISCRNMDEVTRIDSRTGEIIWRLGGLKNQFSFIDDNEGFCWQHDVRRLSNGNILMFNNGNYLPNQVSRVAEYEIDEENMTAKLVWNFIHPDQIYSSKTGSAQRLPNGNTFVNWALSNDPAVPSFTEVTRDCVVVYELYFNNPNITYQSTRNVWLDTSSSGETIKQIKTPSFVQLVPNPADEFVKLYGVENRFDQFTVYSITGKIIFKGDIINDASRQIPTDSWANGIYILQLSGQDIVHSQKLIVRH